MSAEADGNDNSSNADNDNQSEDNFSDATETEPSTIREKKDESDSSSDGEDDDDDETSTDSSEDSLSDSAVEAAWSNHFKSVVKLHAGGVHVDASGSEEEGDFYKLACKQAEQVAKNTAKAKGGTQEEEVGSSENNAEEDVTVTVKLTATVELNGDDDAAARNGFEDSDACSVVSGGKEGASSENKRNVTSQPPPPPVVKVSDPSKGNLKGPAAAKVNGDADESVDPHPIYTASLPYLWPRPRENDREKEKPTKFAKNVPKDASETWDFSLQGLLDDYKSNVLWVDGPFYQKFIGDCLHEMANTPCLSECRNENGEVRKIAMCRKCKVPFCSNQCFKKAKQKQSGEIDSDETSDTNPTGKPNQGEKSQPIRNNLSLNSTQNRRPSYKDVCNKSNALSDNQSNSLDKNQTGKPYQNFKSDHRDRDGNFGGGYNRPLQRNQNQPFPNSYPYPPPGPGGPSSPVRGQLTSPTPNFYPTQVLTNNIAMRSPPLLSQDGAQKILRNPNPGVRSPHLSESGSGEESKSFFTKPLPPVNPTPGFPNGPSNSSGFPRKGNVNQFIPQQSGEDGNWRSKKKQPPFFNNNIPGENFSRPFNDNRGGASNADFDYPFLQEQARHYQARKDVFQPHPQPHHENGPQSGRGRAAGRGGKYQEDIHFRNMNPPSHDTNQRWVDMAKIGSSNVVPAEHPESTPSSYHTASFHGQPPPSSSGGTFNTARTSPSKTSAPSFIAKVDVGKNHLHLNRDVPYGIPLPVKYVSGKSFDDFSVMTLRSHEQFGAFHRNLQTCPKQKMEICELDNFCLAEYPSSDEENAPKQWYRGKITKVVGLVGIYFMDLGIETVLDPRDVYELPQDYVKRWAQAIRLRCLNVKVDQNDPEAVEQFDTLVRGAIMKIRITHQDQTVKFRYACYLDVMYMGKWFDAGVLMKKLFVGDRVSEEEIRQEEDKKAITPLNRVKPPNEPILHEKQTEVIVRFVKSPNEFYITTIPILEAYDLVRKMNNIQVPAQKTKLFAGDLSRLFFLIWDHKEKWQRVKVLEVGMDPDSVVVQKIDIGEIVTVPIKALKPIPDDLKFPSSVFKCSLPVKPNTQRRAIMMQCFEQATNDIIKNIYGANIRVKVLSIDENNTHIVDLFKDGCPDGLTSCLLHSELVEASHGFQLKPR